MKRANEHCRRACGGLLTGRRLAAQRFPRSAARSGSSLIETLAVIVLIATLLSTSSLIFHQALDTHRSSLVVFRELEQLNVWYDRYRSDCQLSVAAELETNIAEDVEKDVAGVVKSEVNQGLLLQRADGTAVRYQLFEHRLIRQVERDGQVTSREAWQAWPVEDAQWTIESTGQLQLISCLLQFSASANSHAPIEWLSRGPVANTEVDQQATSEAGASDAQ